MKINRLFLVLVALFMCQTLFAQRNVLDAYKELQKYDQNFYYKIVKKGNDWKTTSNADYEIPVTVDFKNGYIEIEDDGTGGGSVHTQVVLFRTIDKGELIGITTTMSDGVYVSATYNFWKSTSSGWKNVTKEVLPTNFNYANFCSKKMANVDSDFEKDMKYSITLPQYGTRAKLYLLDSPLMIKQQGCEDGSGNKSECELVKTMQNNSYEYVELIWDKANTRFKLGQGVENK